MIFALYTHNTNFFLFICDFLNVFLLFNIVYVLPIFSPSERGKFLALDLGGTNFRVLIIHLKGEHEFEMQSKIYAVPQNIMLGSGEQLFDHIAECLANFMKVNNFS